MVNYPHRTAPTRLSVFVRHLALALCTSLPHVAFADRAQVTDLLISLSNARGDAVGRATRVQTCRSLLRHKGIADLILKYDDARTAHNSLINGWTLALKSRELSPIDLGAQEQQLRHAQAEVREFSEAARAALLRSGCLSTKAHWLGALALALAPVALDKLWLLFKESVSDDARRKELIRDLEGYLLPAWESVGPIAAFDWSTDSYLTAKTATFSSLKQGATSLYVNKLSLVKGPNRYFTEFKEPPPGLKGAYLLYTGPLEELSEYTVFKGKGSVLDQLPQK